MGNSDSKVAHELEEIEKYFTDGELKNFNYIYDLLSLTSSDDSSPTSLQVFVPHSSLLPLPSALDYSG